MIRGRLAQKPIFRKFIAVNELTANRMSAFALPADFCYPFAMFKHLWITVLAWLAGMLDKETQLAIEYLREENKILREKFGPKRFTLNKFQKMRLAATY